MFVSKAKSISKRASHTGCLKIVFECYYFDSCKTWEIRDLNNEFLVLCTFLINESLHKFFVVDFFRYQDAQLKVQQITILITKLKKIKMVLNVNTLIISWILCLGSYLDCVYHFLLKWLCFVWIYLVFWHYFEHFPMQLVHKFFFYLPILRVCGFWTHLKHLELPLRKIKLFGKIDPPIP